MQGTTSSVRSWDYSRSRSCEGKGNQYPAKDIVSKSFEVFLDDLYERQNALGSALMTAFAEMLDLPSDTFNKHYTAGDLGTIRLLFYPGMENNSQEIVDDGISAHTDFEAFTLVCIFFSSFVQHDEFDCFCRCIRMLQVCSSCLQKVGNG